MDLLLHIDVFRLFFEKSHHLIKDDDKEMLVSNIFNNKSAKIFLDSLIEQYCFENFGQTQEQKLKLRQTFKYLIDKNRVIRRNSTETELDAHFIYLAQNYNGNCLFPILISDKQAITSVINDVIILEDASKPNFHWCKSQLAAYNNFTVRYTDFQQGSRIPDFFTHIFSIVSNIREIIIFDRYFNIEQHSNFVYINRNNLPVKWYSWDLDNPNKERISAEKWNNMVASLSSRITFYTTPQKSLIHERKILFENFIIEADEDFAKINLHTQTWKIDVTYNPQLSQVLLNKTIHFTIYTP